MRVACIGSGEIVRATHLPLLKGMPGVHVEWIADPNEEALVSALQKRDIPGLYTLVSNPAWSWAELHQYFCQRTGIHQEIILMESQPRTQQGLSSKLRQFVFGALRTQKEIVNGYVAALMPKIEQNMRATYHMRNAAAEIQAGIRASRYMPYFDNFSVYPGKRLAGISDSRVTQQATLEKIRQQVAQLVEDVPRQSPTHVPGA